MSIANVMSRPTRMPVGAGAATIRTVMVPLSGVHTDAFMLRNAVELTRVFGAHLVAVHLHLDARTIADSIAAADPMGTVGAAFIDNLMKDADERQAEAKRTFNKVCHEARLPTDRELPLGQPSATWLAVEGDEARCFPSYGRGADLVVLLRPDDTGSSSLDLSEAALFGCGRPILLLPPGVRYAQRGTVAIAWKDTAEAARAIAGAIPFIQLADKVVVLTVAEDDDPPDPSGERIVTALKRHNPSVTLRHLSHDERPPVEVLLDTALREGAGLLVMGGYGHSRSRETIFGGFTRTVLRTAPLPVMMAH